MKIIEINGAKSLAHLFPSLVLDPYCIFLDSSQGDGYSILASQPYRVVYSLEEIDKEIEIRSGEINIDQSHPLSHCPFLGGAIGYIGYDAVRSWEPHLKPAKQEPFQIPSITFGFYDTFFVEDHKTRKVYLVTLGFNKDSQRKFDAILHHISKSELPAGPAANGHSPSSVLASAAGAAMESSPLASPAVDSNLSYDEYCSKILSAKRYIELGEIYQVNLSQCLMAELDSPPAQVYSHLRQLNPAPFSAYLDFGEEKILCSSPERFLKVDLDGTILTEPIKGTIHRGETPDEDEKLKSILLKSEKNRAELMMIVDLERNDIGKICEFGSVTVPTLCELRTYATVHHLVSVIQGKLKTNNISEIIQATFPGGSITGAPKLRAMQIIDELEPHNRGIYTGSIGYIDYRRQMDLNIAIRTIVYKKGNYFFPVGGGIVSDSSPKEEFEETLHKGKALAETLKRDAWAINFSKKL